MEILETKIVKRYKIMAFIKKANRPRVIMFNGRVIMLRIGFTTKNNIERTIPPIRYVVKPPDMVKPVII